MTFPATLLLKPEVAETNKLRGVQKKEVSIGDDHGPSVIAALHHGWGDTNRICKEAPFDILNGLRGGEGVVDLLSPYEMLLHYSMDRILPPTTTPAQSRAAWTEEGKKYRK